MADRLFHCSVVTPERSVIDCEARFAAIPAHDGEIGILRGRAPLLCKLDAGKLRIETPDEKHELLIDGGFAEMVEDRLTILTREAVRPDEVEREDAEASLAAAREMKALDDASFEARQRALKRARLHLRSLGGGS